LADAFDELDFEYATGVAEKAMLAIAEQRVPPTPNNFHVWFKYALGAPPELKRTINILIAGKRKFDAATNRDLFKNYVGSKATDDAVAHHVSQQLHGVMESARNFLSTAISDNRSQMESLDEVQSECQVAADPRPIIEKLLKELSQATSRPTSCARRRTSAWWPPTSRRC